MLFLEFYALFCQENMHEKVTPWLSDLGEKNGVKVVED
jgi:hypothetical protein